MLCGSSSLCSSWECLCWSRELNPDPADLGSSSWVWAEWSHPGLQGMQLEFHIHLIFSALLGYDFVLLYIIQLLDIVIILKSAGEDTGSVLALEGVIGEYNLILYWVTRRNLPLFNPHATISFLYLHLSCRSFTKQRIWTLNPRARQWGGTTPSQCCSLAWGNSSSTSSRCWHSPALGMGSPARQQWQREPRMMVSLKVIKITILFDPNF